MSDFFNRKIKLQADTLELSDFDCEFDVKVSNTPLQPNSMEIKIFNLTPDHRRQLEEHKNRVILSAGYVDAFGEIFNGEMMAAWSERVDADWVTTLQTGDGLMPIAMAGINTSLGKKTSVRDVIQELASSMGLKVGNLKEMMAAVPQVLMGAFGNRTVLSGNSARLMTDITDQAGMSWSVQNGELHLNVKGEAVKSSIGVLLTPDNGLVGSPTLEAKGTGSFSNPVSLARTAALQKPGHVINIKCLINPFIRINGVVKVETKDINGGYRVLQMKYKGDTRDKDWYMEIVGVHYPQ